MSKKRKTRRQKEISKLRRELQSIQPKSSLTYEFSSPQPKEHTPTPIHHTVTTQSTKNYSYVLSDISKTLMITAVIFVANFILFFLIQKNFIDIIK